MDRRAEGIRALRFRAHFGYNSRFRHTAGMDRLRYRISREISGANGVPIAPGWRMFCTIALTFYDTKNNGRNHSTRRRSGTGHAR